MMMMKRRPTNLALCHVILPLLLLLLLVGSSAADDESLVNNADKTRQEKQVMPSQKKNPNIHVGTGDYTGTGSITQTQTLANGTTTTTTTFYDKDGDGQQKQQQQKQQQQAQKQKQKQKQHKSSSSSNNKPIVDEPVTTIGTTTTTDSNGTTTTTTVFGKDTTDTQTKKTKQSATTTQQQQQRPKGNDPTTTTKQKKKRERGVVHVEDSVWQALQQEQQRVKGDTLAMIRITVTMRHCSDEEEDDDDDEENYIPEPWDTSRVDAALVGGQPPNNSNDPILQDDVVLNAVSYPGASSVSVQRSPETNQHHNTKLRSQHNQHKNHLPLYSHLVAARDNDNKIDNQNAKIAHAARIAALQQDVLHNLQGGMVKVQKFFHKYPFMSLQVDQHALQSLAEMHELVEHIDLDHVVGGHGSQNSVRGIKSRQAAAESTTTNNKSHSRRQLHMEHRHVLGYSVPLIGADERHARGNKGAGVTVAVLDSGCDSDHPDLLGNGSFVHKYDACFGDSDNDGRRRLNGLGFCPNGSDRQSGDGSAEDDNGHGTTVTGIITSNGGHHLAPPGVAPDADIISIKVLDKSNSFYVYSEILDALEYLIDLLDEDPDAFQLINLSLGSGFVFPDDPCDGPRPYQRFSHDAIETLRHYNVTTIAAAGNNGKNGLNWPACLSNVISVGSTDSEDHVYEGSNYGRQLDVFAPGVKVDTTKIGGLTSRWTGTSHACPHVTGCAALLIQSGDATTPEEIEARLKLSDVLVDTRGNTTVPRINCKPAPRAKCRTPGTLSDCNMFPSNEDLIAAIDDQSDGEPVSWTFSPSMNFKTGLNSITMTVTDVLGLSDNCSTSVLVNCAEPRAGSENETAVEA